MTEEQLTAFITQAKGDFRFQEKLKDAADVDAIAAIARESGFSISADDLKNVPEAEISDKELEVAVGGTWGPLTYSLCYVLSWADGGGVLTACTLCICNE